MKTSDAQEEPKRMIRIRGKQSKSDADQTTDVQPDTIPESPTSQPDTRMALHLAINVQTGESSKSSKSLKSATADIAASTESPTSPESAGADDEKRSDSPTSPEAAGADDEKRSAASPSNEPPKSKGVNPCHLDLLCIFSMLLEARVGNDASQVKSTSRYCNLQRVKE